MAKHETITLNYPVQLADRTLDKITMRRPTLGEMLDFPINGGTDLAGEVALVAQLCGLREDDLRLLDAADYDQLQATLVRFRTKSKPKPHPVTGPRPVASDPVGPDGLPVPDVG